MRKKYRIQFGPDAQEHLLGLTKYVQKILLDNIEKQLLYFSQGETKKIKRLKPDSMVEWELRLGEFRVFFDVDENSKKINIIAIGKKEHNKLYIGGREFIL